MDCIQHARRLQGPSRSRGSRNVKLVRIDLCGGCSTSLSDMQKDVERKSVNEHQASSLIDRVWSWLISYIPKLLLTCSLHVFLQSIYPKPPFYSINHPHHHTPILAPHNAPYLREVSHKGGAASHSTTATTGRAKVFTILSSRLRSGGAVEELVVRHAGVA